MSIPRTRTDLHTHRAGTPGYDAEQDLTEQVTALVEIVEGMPSRINPNTSGAGAAVTSFWAQVGALAVANGFDPDA